MRPSLFTLALAAIWFCFGLFIGLATVFLELDSSRLTYAWSLYALAILSIILIDYRISKNVSLLSKREMPGSFSLGAYQQYKLALKNNSGFTIKGMCCEQCPEHIRFKEQMPTDISLPDGKTLIIEYTVSPEKRGEAIFERTDIRYKSRLGLLDLFHTIDNRQHIRVYPNFMSIARLKGLDDHTQILQLGLHLNQRRGEGTEFRQLREYRDGDAIRHIDWKTSSKQNKLVVREYQDERDQQVFFLIDCGRKMRTLDGDFSHFDHVLNAFLLSSFVALRQGDAVGAMMFAGNKRFIKPVKGQQAINTILNQVYDIHSTLSAADYLDLALRVSQQSRRRSLLVIISNFDHNQEDNIFQMIRHLKRHHLIMVANVYEKTLDENRQMNINSFDDALLYSSSINHLDQKDSMLRNLKKEGVIVVNSTPDKVHSGLVSEYLSLKRSGRF